MSEKKIIDAEDIMSKGVREAIKKSIEMAEAQVIMNEVLLKTVSTMQITGAEASQFAARKEQIEKELDFNKVYLAALKTKFQKLLK